MKKIIEGKKYDTETAEYICKYSIGYAGDFKHFSDTLYRKKNGEFFIYGEGGPMSKYSEIGENNSIMGSEQIIPISVEEARTFVERYGSVKIYESTFGEVDE